MISIEHITDRRRFKDLFRNEPVTYDMVRVLPFQQIEPDMFLMTHSFSWQEVVRGTKNIDSIKCPWLTGSYWIVRGPQSDIPNQVMLVGGTITPKDKKKQEVTEQDIASSGAQRIAEKLHDFSTVPEDISIHPDANRSYLLHHKGPRLHNEYLTTTETMASFRPLSVREKDKIDSVVKLSPPQIRSLFKYGHITVIDETSDSSRVITLVDSLRMQAENMGRSIKTNDEDTKKVRARIIEEAEKFEARVRCDVLMDLLRNSDHVLYGRNKRSRWRRERLQELQSINFERIEDREAMLGKYDPRNDTYEHDDSMIYYRVLSTFRNNSHPYDDATQQERITKSFADWDINNVSTKINQKRKDLYLRIGQQYYLIRQMAQSIRRRAIRSDVYATKSSGNQEPYLAADFLPAAGYLGAAEWNIATHRGKSSNQRGSESFQTLNHSFVKLYQVLLNTFDIDPNKHDKTKWGILLLKKLERVRRLRANIETLNTQEIQELESVKRRLYQEFQEVTGITVDIFSRLSFDINRFLAGTERDILSTRVGGLGVAQLFNLTTDIEATRLLDLFLVMFDMNQQHALKPDGTPNPLRKPISSSYSNPQNPWASRMKLLLMMDLFESNRDWYEKMRTNTEELDLILESLKADDEEGLRGKLYYYVITEKNTPDPKIKFYAEDEIPANIAVDGHIRRVKLNFKVDDKPVYIFYKERDKDPLERLRKTLAIDPMASPIMDEFARYLIIWTKSPNGEILFHKDKYEWFDKTALELETRTRKVAEEQMGWIFATARRKPTNGISHEKRRGRSPASERLAPLKMYERVYVPTNSQVAGQMSEEKKDRVRIAMKDVPPGAEMEVDGATYRASAWLEDQYGDALYYAWKIEDDVHYREKRLLWSQPGSGRKSFFLLLNPRGRILSEVLYRRLVTASQLE